MYKIMKRSLAGDPSLQIEEINPADMKLIKDLFLYKPDKDGHKHHENWLPAIRKGDCGFGRAKLSYSARGKGAWKEQALAQTLI